MKQQQLVDAIANMEEDEALELAQEMLAEGDDPQLVLDACRQAMSIVGDRYERKEYFLPELIIGGDILKSIGEVVKPQMKSAAAGIPPVGKVVLGTVAGDIHDVGKDIVSFMLDVNNIEVHDLGVDVPADVFVAKVREVRPEVLAMSGFLTLSFDSMKGTVEAVKAAGLRDGMKIMIGGAVMDESVRNYIGADAYGPDASAAVRLALGWMGDN